jgi:UDP-2,3-diacylglucosamine hydrolase
VDQAWFISDLHLHEERPHVTEAFFSFLDDCEQQSSNQTCALYMLGDLFDAWIGDDDDSPLAVSILNRLKQTSSSGIQLFFMPGNRDFLAGSGFESHTGSTLLEDPHLISLGDQKALLMHGDTLCTDDTDYQKFRSMVRSQQWQDEVLAKSLDERRELAKALRQDSIQFNQDKPAEIMDVNQDAVEKVFLNHNTDTLIHGHTHRPATHHHTVSGKECLRIVLGDWDQMLWNLHWKNGELVLHHKHIQTGHCQ